MTTAMQIYELPQEIADLADAECTACEGRAAISAADGGQTLCQVCGGTDMFAALEPRLRMLSLDIERSALGIGRLWRELDGEAALLEQHARELLARADQRRRRVEALKKFLLLEMSAAGVSKAKDHEVTVYMQRNPTSLEVIDEAQVPARYKRAHIELPLADVPEEWAPQIKRVDILKAAMNDDLRDGGVIPPGCEVRNGYHVRVR